MKLGEQRRKQIKGPVGVNRRHKKKNGDRGEVEVDIEDPGRV